MTTLEPRTLAQRLSLFGPLDDGTPIYSYRALCAWVDASEAAGRWLDPRPFKQIDLMAIAQKARTGLETSDQMLYDAMVEKVKTRP